MLALRATPGTDHLVELREVPESVPLPSEALVRVRASSLNAGEAAMPGGLPRTDRDLTALEQLISDGKLSPVVSQVVSWREANLVMRALLDRKLHGKAVFSID